MEYGDKNMKINFYLVLGFLFLLLIPFALSIDIQSLVNSYNYNFFGEEIDIVNITSYRTGDYISFDVNVSNVTYGTYTFYVDLKDSGNVISGSNNGTISSQGTLVNINISTYLLSGLTNFNYTLRAYNPSNVLVYREANLSTGTVSSYNPGYSVISTSNSNLNNNILQVNVSLNSTLASTENFTLILKYNTNSSVSNTQMQTLGTGVNIIAFNFDNETIKSTHYNGTYNVSSLSIGQKCIAIGTSSSTYNYEDFAKTSYLQRYNSTFRDFDADNLTDQIDFNFTIGVKTNGVYTVEAEIYDLYDNYIATLSKNESLTTGNQPVIIPLNGSNLYSIGIDGPYQISESRLISNGVVIDSE